MLYYTITMTYYTILYCTVLYDNCTITILYYTILYYTTLHYTTLHYTTQGLGSEIRAVGLGPRLAKAALAVAVLLHLRHTISLCGSCAYDQNVMLVYIILHHTILLI